AEDGAVVTAGLHIMKSTSPVASLQCRAIIEWLRAEAGTSSSDPLADARARWVAWRANQVTKLVRNVHAAAVRRRPPAVVSSSGGPSPVEFYACYRDARRWLDEGLNTHVFPMNYTADLETLREKLDVQWNSTPPERRQNVYPGLQIYSRRTVDGEVRVEPQHADIVEGQLRLVHEVGYTGFALFAYNTLSEDVVEAVRRVSQATDPTQ
ncbi:MAG: family 10 glycosylhydrolase, partial [Planctomycetales bacterium]|nr:family 10 glycosylhydrolase [Planctomycetales bacterium]